MIVYTAISGAYQIKRTDIKCFTCGEEVYRRPVMAAKAPKILSHLYLPDADVTIWTDANIWLLIDPQEAVDTFLGDADIALVRHPYRERVWQEFATLHDQRRFQIPWLQAQLYEQEAAYRAAGLPDDTGLYECNLVIRKNNDRVNRINESWWSQVCKWQWRDQVSLPYVLWRNAGFEVRVNRISVRDDPRFRYESQY